MIIEATGCPASPPSGGSVKGMAKATDASVGVDVIVLFSLAIVQTKSKAVLKANFNPQ